MGLQYQILSKVCVFGHCLYVFSEAATSIYLYVLVLAYTVSVSIQRARLGEHGHATHLLPVKRMGWLPTLLTLSYLSRIAWLVLSEMHAFEWAAGVDPVDGQVILRHTVIDTPILPTDVDLYVLNVTSFGKLATLLYFSAFTLLLQFWEDTIQYQKSFDQRLRMNRMTATLPSPGHGAQYTPRWSQKLFTVANVWIYLVELALLVLNTLFPGSSDSFVVLGIMDYGAIAVFFALLAFRLGRCAYKLQHALGKIEFSPIATSLARRIAILGGLSSSLFFVRSILLLISTPALDVIDPHRSNPWIFYTIPELIPGFVLVYMISVKKQAPICWNAEEAIPLMEHQRRQQLQLGGRMADISPFQGHELHI